MECEGMECEGMECEGMECEGVATASAGGPGTEGLAVADLVDRGPVSRRDRAALPRPRLRRVDPGHDGGGRGGGRLHPVVLERAPGAGHKSRAATAAYEAAREQVLAFAGRPATATRWRSSAATRPRPSTTSPTGCGPLRPTWS